MNILKKTLTAASAAMICLGAMTAACADSAESESTKFRLLVSNETLPVEILFNRTMPGLGFCGADLIDFTDEDAAHWRETGEFTYTNVAYDFEIPASFALTNGSEYIALNVFDSSKKIAAAKVLRYDRENVRVDVVSEFELEDTGSCAAHAAGYIFYSSKEEKSACIRITAPDGTEKEFDFIYGGEGSMICRAASSPESGYLCFIFYTPYDGHYEVCGITADMEAKTLYSFDADGGAYSDEDKILNVFACIYGDCASWPDYSVPDREIEVVYSVPEEKCYYVWARADKYFADGRLDKEDGTSARVSNVFGVHGGKAVVVFDTGYCVLAEAAESIEELVTGEYTAVSDAYLNMSTCDGEIYMVQKPDGKITYMDGNGSILADFDDAADFVGEYTAVTKDGKVFLVDRQMNRVSEMTEADAAAILSYNGFYLLVKDGNLCAMTYAENVPENAPDESIPESIPEDNEKPAENPPTGIGFSFVTFGAVISAAVIVTTAKKRPE